MKVVVILGEAAQVIHTTLMQRWLNESHHLFFEYLYIIFFQLKIPGVFFAASYLLLFVFSH